MINLLPYDTKSEIRAGRTNVLLVRYILILVCAAALIGALLAGSYIVLNNTKAAAETKVAENEARTSSFNDIKQQSDSLRSDLATAKQIFASDVSFSKLVYRIAAVIPSAVVLDSLTLDPATFGTSMDLTASAKTFADATKLRDALGADDTVFTDVRLQTIQNGGSTAASDQYPVKVTVSVTIKKEAIQ